MIGIPRSITRQSDARDPLAPFGVPRTDGVIAPRVTFAGVSGDAKKIVYVLDASGSMMPDFDALRDQLRNSIHDLRPPQSFDIIFINEHNPPPMARSLLFATPESKSRAKEYVDSMQPRGGTDPLPAMTKAFALEPDLIYFFIDPTCFPDKKALVELVAEQNRKSPIKLNIIAFEGHDPENALFLKKLATESGGTYKFMSEKDLAGQ